MILVEKKLVQFKFILFIHLIIGVSSCSVLGDDLGSCDGKVRILLDWETERCYDDIYYCFYQEGQSTPIIHTGSHMGYEGYLPTGNYQLAIVNANHKNIDVQMDKGFRNIYAFAQTDTRGTDLRILGPENFYGTGLTDLVVKHGEDVNYEVKPKKLVKNIRINLHLNNIFNISSISGELRGIAHGVHIPTGKVLFDQPSSVVCVFDQVKENQYNTSLNLFGLCSADKIVPVTLQLTVDRLSGPTIRSSLEITEEIHDAFINDRIGYVELDLEASIGEIDGLTIKITDWREGTGEA
ncbi:DUF5119 domain-containing protein [Parabacteroides sp. PF5-9]|uniref:DUF5119 domain-containing protein n=1 Tax=Parabacteroides sp. PF5-9 TaxID=1742404 RepID=UPI0024739AF6|nr:DUF5119 domain-containing protein [Parabacteroides sp. PF5-9]MDH6358339.1 hypothetical protein [Parabacteroides sp. PF5-9]